LITCTLTCPTTARTRARYSARRRHCETFVVVVTDNERVSSLEYERRAPAIVELKAHLILP